MERTPSLGTDVFFCEVDRVNKADWHQVLDLFDDSNVYQTWSYEAMRGLGGAFVGNKASRLVLRRGGAVVAAAQARIVSVPLLRWGVAYIRWGPMWRLRGQQRDKRVLTAVLSAIQAEYATRRKLSVRLLPYLFSNEGQAFDPVLQAERFERIRTQAAQRTLSMPLHGTLSELRSNLEQKWRNCLNRAEKNDLAIEEGDGCELFARFEEIHREMRQRKRYATTSNVSDFIAIQGDLPPAHKLRVFLASNRGVLAAGVVVGKVGDTGVFLHGATSNAGMTTNSSYLLQWRAIQWLKAAGATSYNLHGINPDTNPGTYRFKAGLAGKAGQDLRYLGTYQSSIPNTSHALIGLAEAARHAYRTGKTAVVQRCDAAIGRPSQGS